MATCATSAIAEVDGAEHGYYERVRAQASACCASGGAPYERVVVGCVGMIAGGKAVGAACRIDSSSRHRGEVAAGGVDRAAAHRGVAAAGGVVSAAAHCGTEVAGGVAFAAAHRTVVVSDTVRIKQPEAVVRPASGNGLTAKSAGYSVAAKPADDVDGGAAERISRWLNTQAGCDADASSRIDRHLVGTIVLPKMDCS